MCSSTSIMFFIFFPTNLAQKFKKSIFLSLFLHFLSNQTCKTHSNLQMRTKPNNHKNTNLLQNQSPTTNQTQISNKTTKPINPTTKPISNKVNLNLQTHKSTWETNTKKKNWVRYPQEKQTNSFIPTGKTNQTYFTKISQLTVFHTQLFLPLSHTLLILSHTCPNQ